jgi:hypothetical protein
MGHHIRAFVGSASTLAALTAGLSGLVARRLEPASSLLVLPLDEELHDALHRLHGTGEWLERGPRLTTRDLAIAADASRGSALAYVETDYFGGTGSQSAVVWHDGEISLRPVSMASQEAATRAPQFWPVNAALRALGVVARKDADEFTVLGLGNCRNHEALVARGAPVRIGM